MFYVHFSDFIFVIYKKEIDKMNREHANWIHSQIKRNRSIQIFDVKSLSFQHLQLATNATCHLNVSTHWSSNY